MSDAFRARMGDLKTKYNMSTEVVDYVLSLGVNEVQQKAIESAEQRSSEWFAARVGRVTASAVADLIGHGARSSPKSAIKNLLWGTFTGNKYTEHGVIHEEDGRNVFMRYYKNEMVKRGEDPSTFEIKETGLYISLEHPWIGVSPDGLCYINGEIVFGLEIKCPYYAMYDTIPPYYYDQIQLTMAMMGIPSWYFVIWTPTHSKICQFDYDATYFNTVMMPRLEKIYMEQYAPLLHGKSTGILLQDEVVLPDPCIPVETVVIPESTEVTTEDVHPAKRYKITGTHD